LLSEDVQQLASDAKQSGDAQRGAILFHQQWMTCTQCHSNGPSEIAWAPDLTVADSRRSDVQLVQSVLRPSLEIEPAYKVVSVVTVDGRVVTGLRVDDANDQQLQLRNPTDGSMQTLAAEMVEEVTPQANSAMPAGLVNQLTSRTQFLDLIAYLREIRDGGVARARQLQPLPSQLASKPLPEYEAHVDHAKLIGQWNQDSFKRGKAIYQRLCINCHGTVDQPGSMPTSPRFATAKLKNGSDPFSMYQTLTRGFGAMIAQSWMVPRQKYDVIHYIREAYLKEHHPAGVTEVSDDYLAALPVGDTLGPEPSETQPWQQMDYGPNLIATIEVGSDGHNFAQKGNSIRLDHGAGGVSQGSHWIVYDTDTMRVAAAWRATPGSQERFIDYNCIHFNGRHGVHPRVVGELLFENGTGPGWGDAAGDFTDRRVPGRDDRQYGPLRRDWAHYKGMSAHGPDTLLHYTVGDASIVEMPSLEQLAASSATTKNESVNETQAAAAVDVVRRHLQVQPHQQPLVMQVAQLDPSATLKSLPALDPRTWQQVVVEADAFSSRMLAGQFDGQAYLHVPDAQAINMFDQDYTLIVRFRTRQDGTLVAKTAPQAAWVPDAKALFVRGGQLCFDIGWVGALKTKRRVDDGRPHTAAVIYQAATGEVTLLVDGKREAHGTLRPKQSVAGHELRIGLAAENFPAKSPFRGTIERVAFFQQSISETEWEAKTQIQSDTAGRDEASAARLVDLRFSPGAEATRVEDASGQGHHAVPVAADAVSSMTQPLTVGLQGMTDGLQWSWEAGNLRLQIPPTATTRSFTIHHLRTDDATTAAAVAERVDAQPGVIDLQAKTNGGPKRWRTTIETEPEVMFDQGPFAVDQLTYPRQNPWFCRMRLTGIDFFSNGDSAAVSDWDGNVWRVDGLLRTAPADAVPTAEATAGKPTTGDAPKLRWTRIASGLFQPLGVKILDDQVFVSCRDQICILRDLNGDGETDYYESFNNDHQVTEHFHEFAMGLQADAEGNLYYAKSARHALKAVVPHHGTLLKVSSDGSETKILATGFRAANGVCLNPDGTFFVTDQEGHWNPKNRINWVREGGFYGNMFGYHDVTDSSDSAMQPPLCWITNAFDRSPAELLWVDSDRWGPLNGSLLNLSYGYGKAYIVPHEQLGDVAQGGMCELPIPMFPTGVHRGRFHPTDGQLYLCGMFAWAGTQHEDGGLFRLRYTGRPAGLPTQLKAKDKTLTLQFSESLGPAVPQPEDFQITTWGLKRTANYGSKHYDTKTLPVTTAQRSEDGRTVTLSVPDMQPTWCMEIRCRVQLADGEVVERVIHNSIHRL